MHPRRRLVLTAAAIVHFVHDGFSDALYVLFPVWAAAFRLAYAQVGLIKLLYLGGMTLFQIPAGLLAERHGERGLLAAGTALTAAGFIAAAAGAATFPALAVFLLLAGLGSGVQHPLGSSLVSKAYEAGARRVALGTYNFSGDLGKIAAAAAMGVTIASYGWRPATAGLGAVGLAAAVALWMALTHLQAGGPEPPSGAGADYPGGWGIRDRAGFRALSIMGLIDNGTRTAFLTFLPFALVAKGSTPAGVGAALALVFAGGAAGKLICGLLAEEFGVIRTVVLTEAATALGILLVVLAPLGVAVATLVPVGIALNGTSSVLYATVADLVAAERRSRAYGLYYTISLSSSAVAPLAYGIVADLAGVPVTLSIIAIVVLVTIPLALALRSAIAASGALTSHPAGGV